MTQYFEVTRRDGAARMGKLRLHNTLPTPHIIDAAQCQPASIWNPQPAPRTPLTISPCLPLPLHTPSEFIKRGEELLQQAQQSLQENSWGTPRGIVIHPGGSIPDGFDVYVLGAAADLGRDPRAFTVTLLRIRQHIPPDSALYTPALATHLNLALLIYTGVDLLDYTQATLHAYKDFYFTKNRSMPLQELRELPCNCPACQDHTPASLSELPKKQRAELLEAHNRAAMDAELRLIKQLIHEGRLRDYLEAACRAETWQTASLRLLDAQYTYLEERAPIMRSAPLHACTSESHNRAEVRRFAQRIQERYTPPALDILLLLPCSSRKPYSTSPSHQRIHHSLAGLTRYIHEVILTSPLGIVPRELELTYPAAHYDTPVTGHWDREERSFTEQCLADYLIKHSYETIIAHVTGAYREICETVAEQVCCEMLFTAQDNNILSSNSLQNLREHIESAISDNTLHLGAEERKKQLMRAVADYQFGAHTGVHLIPDDSTVKAPYPKHQVHHRGRQMASLIPQYGTLALTLHGAERLAALHRHIVTIDEFTPKGTILAAGVIDADPRIREGDDVVVQNSHVLAVGRAHMSGGEMKKSRRGVAVNLRHTTK